MILSSISKAFDSAVVLDDVSLHLQDGQTYALIGPSGCGKTTLLKLMIGLIWADQGSVSHKKVVLSADRLQDWRLQFGYVIQDGGLFPHLTARRNICLMAEILGWQAQSMQDRVNELCILTDFPGEALDRYPAQLSGGQRQRVSLMRALMLDPEFLLLDEPLSALDPMIRAGLQRELKEIFKRLNKTVVMVTHDLFEADYFADEIVLMNEGRIVQQATPEQLIANPVCAFAQSFVEAQKILAGQRT